MGRRGRKEGTEGGMRLDERNGEDRFVRTDADGVQGAKMLRNILLFTASLHFVKESLEQ